MEVEVNDIVQIDPEHDDRFGGCLMVVSEVKSWGVQGYVKVPAGGDAYYRCSFDAIAKVGHAEWVHSENEAAP